MITIGQLIDVCNHGDNLVDEICGGNVSQTIDKLKAIARDPVKAARLHEMLSSLERDVKNIRSTKVGVTP